MFIEKFRSDDLTVSYIGLAGIRKVLSLRNILNNSLAHEPPVQEVIDAGLVYDFIKYLDHNLPEFQFEALWCITNIASSTSDHTQSIVHKGGIKKVINLIDHEIQEIQEQAIWALGNIAGDSIKIRDRVIQDKGFEKIIKHFSTAQRPSLIKHCVWAISNFCRSKPAPEYEVLLPSIDLIISAVQKFKNDTDLLVDASWVLSYLTENHKRSIKKIINTGILPEMMTFLDSNVVYIQLPTLRIIGNIVAGNALQTQLIIDS